MYFATEIMPRTILILNEISENVNVFSGCQKSSLSSTNDNKGKNRRHTSTEKSSSVNIP